MLINKMETYCRDTYETLSKTMTYGKDNKHLTTDIMTSETCPTIVIFI